VLGEEAFNSDPLDVYVKVRERQRGMRGEGKREGRGREIFYILNYPNLGEDND
jgi:hypothetical protein